MSNARRNRGKGRNMSNWYDSPLWDKKEKPEAEKTDYKEDVNEKGVKEDLGENIDTMQR